MKQTSVEWLAFQTYYTMKLEGDGEVWGKIIDKAKEMHKQEIIDALNEHNSRNAETYYEQTYVNKLDYDVKKSVEDDLRQQADELLDPDWSDGDQFDRSIVLDTMVEFAKMVLSKSKNV